MNHLKLTLLAFWLGFVAGAPAAVGDARKDCFEKSGDVAIRACSEAIQRDPKDTVSYVNRAFEYVQKGEHAQSVADYSKAIELDAGRLDAYQGRAWAYLKTGKAATLKATLKKGKYPFLCTLPGHAAAGMKGTLTVK